MLGNGTSTARMELGSMPFFFKPWSTETWMMAPSVGVAITLPLRSCMLVIAESFRTIKCVLGLSLVSIPCPATATTSIPASTALMRSGGVDGAKSNWRPSVPGRTDRFCVTDSVTSRPFFSNKPFSLATHAGSHETTGIYAARTGVSCAAVAGALNHAPIHKILATTTANEREHLSFCATRAPLAKPSPGTFYFISCAANLRRRPLRRVDKASMTSRDPFRNQDFVSARSASRVDVILGVPFDLADVGRKVDGTGVHSLGHRLVNEVDDEYAGLADMLERVLRRAIRRDCKPRTTSAGSSLNTLKKENGAALTTPSLPTVVTRAIGRGTTSAASSL